MLDISARFCVVSIIIYIARAYKYPENSIFKYDDLDEEPDLDYRQLPGSFGSICFIKNEWTKCPREWLLQNMNSVVNSARDRQVLSVYPDHRYNYNQQYSGDNHHGFVNEQYYPYHMPLPSTQVYTQPKVADPSVTVGYPPTLQIQKYNEYPIFKYRVTDKPNPRYSWYSYVNLVTEPPKRIYKYNRISYVTEASKPLLQQYIFASNAPEPNNPWYNTINHELQVAKPQYNSFRSHAFEPSAQQYLRLNYENNAETPINYVKQVTIPKPLIMQEAMKPRRLEYKGNDNKNATTSRLAAATSNAVGVVSAEKDDVKRAQLVEAKTTAIDTKETHVEVTEVVKEMAAPPNVTDADTIRNVSERDPFYKFQQSVDKFERKFYEATFTKLAAISPADRRENGISFVQSGLFMYLLLLAFEMEEDPETMAEIAKCIDFPTTRQEKLDFMKRAISTLPVANEGFKFRWSTRLVLGSANVSQEFLTGPASLLQLRISQLNGTETPEALSKSLNHMVEEDSGGAMRETFEEDELSQGVKAALMSTMYVRGRWRASPTLLNGTRPFRDAEAAPQRSTRMIRINDVMKYADLTEFDAEAIEISYSTQGLTLLLMIPRGRSLRKLAEMIAFTEIASVTDRMSSKRVAATIPLYTLRMTLLLPSKLQAMGITRLVDATSDSGGSLRLSHAVQRLMFWAEAGRNAFKDDGIEWDEPAELELMVDRPYLFFVRWHNMTLMNGNFVL